MPDLSHTIKVKFEVTAGSEKTFSEPAEMTVKGCCVSYVVVPADTDDKATEVSIAPEVSDPVYFNFLLIRPMQLGDATVTPADLCDPAKPESACLTYGVPCDDPKQEQRKPLRGSHVFANGQTEWVTDMLQGGHPGGLTRLRFWSRKKAPKAEADLPVAVRERLKGLPDADRKKQLDKLLDPGQYAFTIQVIAGYSPLLLPAPAKKC